MSPAVRLSAIYGGIFLVIGIHMPFWPVWLTARGLDPGEIGIVIAAGGIIRIGISPWVARICDRTGERRRPMIVLTALAAILFLPFAVADGFWQILFLQALFAGALGPLMPIAESLTMIGAREHGLDYGRIRLWGSLTFILGASGVGFFLKGAAPDLIWAAILGALLLSATVMWSAPDFRAPAADKHFAPMARVLSDRTFLVFLAATACVQGSHALYYGFGTIHWLRLGFGEGMIGLLWAEGVLAEVILFVFAAGAVRKIGPARLIALGGVAALLRWGIAAETSSLSMFVVLQILHAITFGASHLGAVYFISERMPAEVSATAQTAYALISSGLAIGLTSLASGYLYAAFAGQAYWMMAGMGAVGACLAWSIRRQKT